VRSRAFVFAALAAGALWLGAGPAAAAYTAQINGSTLQLVGDKKSDKLALRLQSGAPTVLEVDVGDNGSADFTFDRNLFTGISVGAGAGNDFVRIDQVNGLFSDESIVVDGGPGNDTFLGGSGNDFFIGGDGDDFADGNPGLDTALLGAGNDTFHWDPGDMSDIVEGQDGSDTLDFAGGNVSERIDISANGGRIRFTRDVGTVTMDTNDVERFLYHAFGGVDMLTTNDLSGTDASMIVAELAAPGGGGDGSADTVVVNGTAGPDHMSVTPGDPAAVNGLSAAVVVTDGEPANDTLSVPSGDSDDVITTGVGPAGPAIAVDGGNGTDATHYEGTKGSDTIAVVANAPAATLDSAGATAVNSTAESLTVSGLGGNDTISCQGNLAAITSLVLDGGKGNDLLLGSNGADHLVGDVGNDFVDGNQGDDTALLGTGNDTLHWDPGDMSDIVEGQAGSDTLEFNGANIAERIELSPNGGRVRFTRDIGTVTMDTDGVESFAFRALAGADTVTVGDMTGTDAKTVAVDLAAPGGGGGDLAVDSIVLNGTPLPDKVKAKGSAAKIQVSGLPTKALITGAEPASDQLHILTGDGDDTVSVASAVFGLIQLFVDLGPGN
jgi:Ca2+-binding RTX toxin-like protein